MSILDLAPEKYIAHILINQARSDGATPRVHPNGFIQLPVVTSDGEERRIHVWPEPGVLKKQETDSPIHDHVFSMHSRILVGALRQQHYGVLLGHGGEPNYEVFMAKYSSKDQSTLEPTGVKVKVGAATYTDYRAGLSYTQEPFTFHESVPMILPVVTLMTKVLVYPGEPRVLCPIGQEPDNKFDRLTVEPGTLWQIIEDAIQ